MNAPVSLVEAAGSLTERWSPRVVGQANGQYIKVARVEGEFPWHTHAAEDELFLVLRGELRILRAPADGGDVLLRAGEIFVVPRGVRHATAAREDTWIALVEPCATRHTGELELAETRSVDEQLRPLTTAR